MAAVDTNRGPRTYGNWRRPTSPGILGLGSIGTALLLAGLIAVVMTVMIAGLLEAVILAAVLGAVMLAVLTKDSHGKNVISRGGARIAWWSSRSRGSNVYRSGPLGRALWGTYQLPGLAAPTRLSEWQDSYGRPFALLYTPATGSYSVVIGTEPDGAALVDQEQIDVWVADWGHWLANLGDEPGVEAASVTIEENLVLKSYRRPPISVGPFVKRRAVRSTATSLIERFGVKAPSPSTSTRLLSGGNVQKVLLAREFSAAPKVLIAASPTRGLDVGAIETVRALLLEAARSGVAVLLMTEDLDEAIALADRILVMYEGRIAGEVPRGHADITEIGLLMGGGRPDEGTGGEGG